MNRQEKNEKKRIISQNINLGNGRYKDNEIDRLFDISTNYSNYANKTKTKTNTVEGWSSEGKFTRKEETKLSFQNKGNNICIREDYSYRDDDGQTGKDVKLYDTGRDILNNIHKFF